MDFVPPLGTYPHPFFALVCPAPWEAKLCGLYHLGSLLTWVPPVGDTGKRLVCRKRKNLGFPQLCHIFLFSGSGCFLLRQQLLSAAPLPWLRASLGSGDSVSFLLPFQAGVVITSSYSWPLATSASLYGCLCLLHGPFIKVSWII